MTQIISQQLELQTTTSKRMSLMLMLMEEERQRSLRAQKIFRDRRSSLDYMSDNEIISKYRQDRASILHLSNYVLFSRLSKSSKRNHVVSPELQVCTALRFFATGSFYSVLGDVHGLSKASV